MMKTPKIDLSIFYQNIDTLKVKSFNSKDIGKKGVLGNYDKYSNEVHFSTYAIYSIYHELMHAASTIKQSDKIFSGFSIADFDKNTLCLGKYFNEGYTELLTERYFPNDCELTGNIYFFAKKIAGIIEIIIGKDQMENLYFNANLKGLIKELSKYGREAEIEEMISYVDIVESLYYDNIDKKEIGSTLVNIIHNLETYLFKTYFNKLCLSNFSESEIGYRLLNFLNLLDSIYLPSMNGKIYLINDMVNQKITNMKTLADVNFDDFDMSNIEKEPIEEESSKKVAI